MTSLATVTTTKIVAQTGLLLFCIPTSRSCATIVLMTSQLQGYCSMVSRTPVLVAQTGLSFGIPTSHTVAMLQSFDDNFTAQYHSRHRSRFSCSECIEQ